MDNLIFSNNSNKNSHSQKNKINFNKLKNNTFNSLNEVEYFLNDFRRFSNYIKLYKILK